jgi:hypothetical protein
MTESARRSDRAQTPPFAALLAKSLIVCVVGGAFFGALFAVGLEVAASYSPATLSYANSLVDLANAAVILVLAVAWAMLLVLPVALPAGGIAAGLIWYLRGLPWRPHRGTWLLLGIAAGMGVAAALAALATELLQEGAPLFWVSTATGGACGAVLAWLEWPLQKRVRSDAEQAVAADEVRVG